MKEHNGRAQSAKMVNRMCKSLDTIKDMIQTANLVMNGVVKGPDRRGKRWHK